MEDLGIPQALVALRVSVILVTAIFSSAMKVFHTIDRAVQSVPPLCEQDYNYIPTRTYGYGRKGGGLGRMLGYL
jgi:hypothetical protein